MDDKTKSKLKANWELVSGKFKSKYGEMVDDKDLKLEGDIEQTMGKLRKKTNKTVQEIETEMEQMLL